ncbi:MAG TPA: hypothetical protein VL362_02340 [Patescibacteria group bacterium]|jgi:hypothetical protein|nr:hypothetical protein [Patescibacteria group bacterium]
MAQKVKDIWRSLGRWVFQDETGKYVSAQPPNVSVYLIIAGYLGQSVTDGKLNDFFALLATGAVFTWALLEIMYGKSMFRRALGTVVMTVFFVGRLTM